MNVRFTMRIQHKIKWRAILYQVPFDHKKGVAFCIIFTLWILYARMIQIHSSFFHPKLFMRFNYVKVFDFWASLWLLKHFIKEFGHIPCAFFWSSLENLYFFFCVKSSIFSISCTVQTVLNFNYFSFLDFEGKKTI